MKLGLRDNRLYRLSFIVMKILDIDYRDKDNIDYDNRVTF